MKQVKIFFDEPSHTYTDEEGNKYTSSTQMISKVSVPYDSQFWAVYRILDKKGLKLIPRPERRVIEIKETGSGNPFADYEKYTIEDLVDNGKIWRFVPKGNDHETILAKWKMLAEVACEWGNERHNYMEDMVNSWYGKTTIQMEPVLDSVSLKELPKFRMKIDSSTKLYDSPLRDSHPTVFNLLAGLINSGYTLYAEKRVYSYKHKISGMIDLLAVKGKEFYIVDWKTNKDDLKFESGYFKKEWNATRTQKVKTNEWVQKEETFLYPLDSVIYSKGYVYTLQLSLYAYICELWGMKCKGLILVHIRHDEKISEEGVVTKTEKSPRIYKDIVYMKDAIKKLFDWHVSGGSDKKRTYVPGGMTNV